MSEWNDFLIAISGASAALTGLVFVGISISLDKILANPTLPNRAFISLLLLLTMLVVSILFLVPGQSHSLLGIEVLSTGLISWVVAIVNDVAILRDKDTKYRRVHTFNMLLDQLAVLPYIICAICLLTGHAGLPWIVPAVIFSLIKSVVDAWVLLVEINR